MPEVRDLPPSPLLWRITAEWLCSVLWRAVKEQNKYIYCIDYIDSSIEIMQVLLIE